MKRALAIAALCFVSFVVQAQPFQPSTIQLTGTIRDFQSTHPDMQYRIGFDFGIVEPILGPDRKPVYTTTQPFTFTTHGRELFDQWYRDVPGVNLRTEFTLPLTNSAASPSVYTYDNQNFFPINGQLFGNQGMANNYYFTFELHSRFTYQGGEVFNFRGDDDVWVFINKRRVIDLGGVHAAADAGVNLNAVAAQIGLVVGGTYDFDLFFAERFCCGSSFRIQTSIVLEQPPEEEQGHAVVRYTGDRAGDYHDPATLSAELLDDSENPPVAIPDAVLTFRLGNQSCKAPTDAQGRASCSLTPDVAAGDQPLRVEFPGDFLHAAAEASDTFSVRREQALLTAASARAGIGGAVRAVLREDGAVPVAGRTVTFRSGALSASAVTGADGAAAATLALPPGEHSVEAVFDGDGFYAASTATWNVRVLPPQIAILPQPNVAAVGSAQAVTAQILDLGAARLGERIGFDVVAGPNVGAAGTCEPAGCTADASGRATFRYTGGPAPGSDTVRAYLDANRNGAFDAGEAQATAILHWTSRHATEIRYDGAPGGDYHDAARLSAILVDTEAEPDAPVAGALLAFSSPAGSCAARTDAAGRAFCWITPQVEAGSYELLVDFAGDSRHRPARAAGTFAVTREQTTLTITSPAALPTGQAVVRAVLREDGSLPISGRDIVFQAGSVSVHAVTDAAGVATADLGLLGGEHQLSATFAADAFYQQAAATLAGLLVYAPGQFVIWGGNAPELDDALTLGQTCMFWGARWADQVEAGDYAANASFKGYADDVFPATREWQTRPGNSSHPPSTVPAYLGVLISTSIRKNGSTISGNYVGVGVLRVTNPAAYQPNPGHPASGVLLAVLPPDGAAGSAGTPPDAPTGVTATAGEGFAEVRWTPPGDTGSGPITGYTVSIAPGDLRVAVPAGETSRIVTGLAPGTSYSFTVAATNAAGTGPASAPSQAVTSVTVPGAPRTVAAIAGDGSATVTWSPPESDGGSPVLFYRVEPLPAGTPVTVPGETFSASIPGLENGTAYTFVVRAQNAAGTGPESLPSAPVLPVTIPAAPPAVVADAGDRQATVYWTAAAGGGSALASYRVTTSPGGATATVPGDRVFAIVSGLDNGVAYRFSVVAASGAGEGPASVPSADVVPFGVPAAPSALQGTRGNGTALVTWSALASDGGRTITGYVVLASPGDLASAVPAGGTSRLVTGLANGTAYTFRVQAVNEAGAGAPSTASAAVTPATVPDQPTAVQAVAGGGQATVSWTAPAMDGGSPITGSSVVSHPGLQQVNVPAGATTATVGGLTNGTEYVFTVRAANALGRGPESQPSSPVTPAVVPGAPTNVLATLSGVAAASVSWTAPAANGGAPITGYTVTSSPGGLTVSVAGTAASATVGGLTLGTTYTFTVRATNRVGTGPASAPSNAVTAATTPGAPTAVTAVDGNASATVTWTPPASTGFSPISSYTVTSSPGGFTTTVNGATTSAVVSGLANGTEYTFTVRAANAVGSGPSSAPSNPVTPATVPGAPTAVAAAVAGDASVRVTWTPPASNGGAPITGYTVTSTPGGLTASVDGATTSATVPGLTVGTAYTFRVTATNRKGTGAASAPSNAVTAAGAPGAPTNVTAVDGNASATVTWTPPASDGSSPVTGYEVVSSPGGITVSVGAGVTTATVPGLQNGTAYTFTVRAVNAIGAGPFSTPSNPVTPATVPGAPAGVTAALGGNAAALVTWAPPATDGGAPITSYLVTSSPGGLTASAGGTATSARVTGLTVGTTYTFTVAAVNRKGTGPASAPSNPLTAAAVPDAPTGVSATPGDASAVVTWIPPADGGSTPIVTYTVTTNPGGTLTTVLGTVTSATVTGLTNGTAYTFTVRATNAAGTGPESAPSAPVTPHQAGAVVLTGLAVSPSEVTGGSPATGTVSLTGPAPAGGVVVALASNNPAAAVPASVTVPQGSTSASFPITTQAVAVITDVTLSATLDATTRTAVLRLRPVPPGTPPTAEILTPADGAEITTLTQIVGTAVASNLRDWILELAPAGETAFTQIAAGTGPVIAGVLGTFDPTLLLNDLYTVRLRVFTTTGASAEASVAYAVDGNQKIGNFTLSFTDLSVPVSGLPITVIRNYDSRDKKVGDFGVGWTLELRQGSYRNNRTPGQGWEIQSGFLPCQNVQELASHSTVIRLSDQEVYRFRLSLGSPAPTIGGCFADARFDFVDGPVPGATLSILGGTEVFWENGTDYVVDTDTLDLFEPRQVRLTTRDGRIFDLELRKGVTRLQDLNGNNLVIGSSGITHSSGKSISFARDGAGRITSITDPMGKSITYTYDAAGDLIAVADRENQTTRFTYDGNHRLLTIEDPRGIQPLRNEYDADGRLIRNVDAFGKEIEYTHNLAANQEIITDRLGHSRLLEYDDRGNVVREVDALGNETVRTFDARDNVLTETNALGETTVYTYDASGNRSSETDPEGNTTSYTYDSRGYARTITDARGKVARHEYDAGTNLLSITDPLGNATTFTYDARGEVLTQTDSEGKATTYEYDSTGNLTREIDALGHATAYTYDANGNRLTQTTTRTTSGGTETLQWSYSHDDMGRLTSTTDPDGSTTSSVYDAVGNLIEKVDKLGRHTTFSYDDMGRLVATTHPDGTTETSVYDAEGRRTSSTDRAGRTTRYRYDALGRLIETTHPDGAVESNTYDDAGRLVSTTDARGNETSYEYDGAGRRIRTIDALGHATSFEYDGNGQLIAVTDAKGRITRHRYDDAGRQTEISFPDGTLRTTAFDRMGRKVAETDQASKTTSFGYDALGRLITVTDALGQVTSYGYDELGNRVRQTDANGHTTSFEYDALGRQVRRTLPMGASETMEYDAAGNLIRRVDFNGAATTFTYDTNRRLTGRSYPDGTSVGFAYTLNGRRATAVDGRGTTTYQYDSRDRLVRLTDPSGRILEYGWDGQGNRTSLTARIALQTLPTSYAYDALNRPATVTDPPGRSYALSYDEVGNRAAVEFPNGVRTTYEYDALNRLADLTTRTSVGAVLQSYVYTLEPAGHRTRIDEHDGTVRAYEYDSLYRLTRETVSGAAPYESTFTYDPVGNRLSQSKTDASGTTTINSSYDDRDRLLTAAGTTYTWDENGQLRTRSGADGATYVWNFDGRLTQVLQADGTVITHAYDADGNRVRTEITPATGPPTTTEYLVDTTDALSQVVAETNAAGALTAYYVRGDDLLAVMRPGGTRFFHADGLGSVRALTDEAGGVTDTYTFSAFGELLAHTGSDPNAYLFTGEPLDPNSGFYYLRARWLDVEVGRFASTDPAGGFAIDPRTLHRYLYTANDPLNLVDPTGEEFNLPSVLTGISVQGILQQQMLQMIARGAIYGTAFGAADAYFGEGDVATGALYGAVSGAFLASLGSVKALQGLLLYVGQVLAGTSAYEAYMDGDTDLALFRGIFFVAGIRSVISSKPPDAGPVSVYRSINPATGEVQYIGITENFATRAAAHLRQRGISITKIGGLENLSRADARAVEQVLIEYYGIRKNGGILMNKINSISTKNPVYASALIRGKALLEQVGYRFE